MRLVRYFLLGSVLIAAVTVLMWAYKSDRMEEELRSYTQDVGKHYDVMYALYRELADTAFRLVLSRADVIALLEKVEGADETQTQQIRQELYHLIEPEYHYYKQLYFHQFHYHLPDSSSFLRMHSPNRYGDPLADIRYSVRQTNALKRKHEGFEEGRIIHGFRFVYPLFGSDGRHLGSVEASVTAKAFMQAYEQSFKGHVHFIEKMDTVKEAAFAKELRQYHQSIESSDYYYRKDLVELDDPHRAQGYQKKFLKLQPQISEKMALEEPFSIFIDLDQRYNIVTFLPVRNIEHKVVAYMVIYAYDTHFATISIGYGLLGMVLSVIVLLLVALIYTLQKHREEAQRHSDRLEQHVAFLLEEERKTEKILLRQSRLAQMGELINMIAHQWRQPLNAVTAVTTHLRLANRLEILDPQMIEQQINQIDALMQGMSEVISRFRHFYKPGTKPESLLIDDLVHKSLEMMQTLLTGLGVTLELSLKAKEPLLCYGVELEQVLLNLIQNACDEFKRRTIVKPILRIATAQHEEAFEIEIEDNAGGIAAEDLPKIFDPYFTTKEDGGGSGLGLYMCQLIIERHCGGSIEVFNTQNGVCFRIRLSKNALQERRV